jgi:hypothetical protein
MNARESVDTFRSALVARFDGDPLLSKLVWSDDAAGRLVKSR